MPKLKDLAGETFGILHVQRRIESPGDVRWKCLCECGKAHVVLARNLLSGASRSCGCRIRVKRKVKRKASTSGLPKWTAEDQAQADLILGERPPAPVPPPTQATPAPVQPTMADLLADFDTLVQEGTL